MTGIVSGVVAGLSFGDLVVLTLVIGLGWPVLGYLFGLHTRDDLLAWALARNGRCNEALHYSKLALRLGTEDAAKFFHRGVIERCLGHRSAARHWFARSRATNPYWRQP